MILDIVARCVSFLCVSSSARVKYSMVAWSGKASVPDVRHIIKLGNPFGYTCLGENHTFSRIII